MLILIITSFMIPNLSKAAAIDVLVEPISYLINALGDGLNSILHNVIANQSKTLINVDTSDDDHWWQSNIFKAIIVAVVVIVAAVLIATRSWCDSCCDSELGLR